MVSGRLLVCLACLALVSCQPASPLRAQSSEAGVAVEARLDLRPYPMHQSYAVEGRLEISALSGKLASANIECVVLSLGDQPSKQTYYASIASVLPVQPADARGLVRAPVYWTFARKPDIGTAKLVIDPARAQACFGFAAQ